MCTAVVYTDSKLNESHHYSLLCILVTFNFATRSDYVDILKYWTDQSSCNNVPILCQLAEIGHLGMASSSIPVEECPFLETAALIGNGKRSSLKPTNWTKYYLCMITFI